MPISELCRENLDRFPYLEPVEIDLLPNCPALLTQQEAAAVCSVSVQTISRMVSAGTLPVNCDGEILKSDIIAYIKTHTLADIPLL